MFGIRKNLDYANVTEKRIWHPLSLQSLATQDFALVVNKILAGKHGLLTFHNRSVKTM